MPAARLLLLEDDDDLRSSLRRGLTEHGFLVAEAADGAGGLRIVDRERIDAVVLDIGLPDADGRDLCRALRRRGIDVPVLFLTARDALEDRIAGFDVGGDDYLVKPFHLDELAVRLRALLRRAPRPAAPAPEVEVRVAARLLVAGERQVDLTETEARLLGALLDRRGDVLHHDELVQVGWSPGAIVRDNTLQQYAARLRRKLRAIDAPVHLSTVRGSGYRLD